MKLNIHFFVKLLALTVTVSQLASTNPGTIQPHVVGHFGGVALTVSVLGCIDYIAVFQFIQPVFASYTLAAASLMAILTFTVNSEV
ncbi:hypothetical protein DL738_11520 [Escherichia coli]|nr:hypothetical protein [Escherichia coli]